MKIKLAILIITLLQLPNSSAHAEIHLCEGIWKNTPCNSTTTKSFPEKAYSSEEEQKKLEKRKLESALHDLRMHKARAKREHKVDVYIDDVLGECKDPSTNDIQCQKLIAKKYIQITELVQKSKALITNNKDQKRTKKEKEKEDKNTTVIVTPSKTVIFPRGNIIRQNAYQSSTSIKYNSKNGLSISATSGNIHSNKEAIHSDNLNMLKTDSMKKLPNTKSSKTKAGKAKIGN